MTSAILAAALLAGCDRSPGPDTLATVNGKKISVGELDKYYKSQTAGSPQQPKGEEAESLKLSILRQLIDNELLMQRAEKMNLVATDEEVTAKLNEIKSPYSQEEFDQKLKERGITIDDFKQDLRRQLTVDKLLNKEITSKINISDGDISSFYNEHKAEFNLIEPQWHLAQILVTNQPNPQVANMKNDKAQNDADAKKKIERIANMLDNGEDFATLAMNYSEQPNTASSGGDMGMFSESQIKTQPEVYTAVSKLKPGQYSGVLPVYDGPGHRVVGYSIVKLLGKEPAGQRELSDPRVQQAIRQQLRERKEQLLKAAYYEMIRDDAKVKNYYADDLMKNAGQ